VKSAGSSLSNNPRSTLRRRTNPTSQLQIRLSEPIGWSNKIGAAAAECAGAGRHGTGVSRVHAGRGGARGAGSSGGTDKKGESSSAAAGKSRASGWDLGFASRARSAILSYPASKSTVSRWTRATRCNSSLPPVLVQPLLIMRPSFLPQAHTLYLH
jgi:hypothetical protein